MFRPRTIRRLFSSCSKMVEPKKLINAATVFSQQIQSLYCSRNPQYRQIVRFIANEDLIRRADQKKRSKNNFKNYPSADDTFLIPNDHMAIRTIGNDSIGISVIENALVKLGYQPRDCYIFEKKNVRARWYAPPVADVLPRLFISEVLTHRLSQPVQSILAQYVDKRRFDSSSLVKPMKHGCDLATWLDEPIVQGQLTFKDYKTVLQESEYAAWTLLNGSRINHCTIPVSLLCRPYNRIENLVSKLQKDLDNVSFNDNGAIQCSSDNKLKQASTVAIQKPFLFADRSDAVFLPSSFVEFIERRREGFETKNADQILESTDYYPRLLK